MEWISSAIFLLLGFLPCVRSTAFCGLEICHGDGAYCCVLDTGDEGCCWTTYVYEFWWFWAIWVAVFFFILACSLRIWRRRVMTRRIVTMRNSQYPTYGTVVVQSSNSSQNLISPVAATGPHGFQQMPPQSVYAQGPPGYVPGAPPSYAAAEASKNEKPPAYTA